MLMEEKNSLTKFKLSRNLVNFTYLVFNGIQIKKDSP